MNRFHRLNNRHLPAAAVAATILMLSGCAADAVKNPGAARVRADLSAIQANPQLANAAPIAMKDAEQAVRSAELADTDRALTDHRVYIADRKVQTTRALAQAQSAIDQRKALSDASDKIRLDARTREADGAKMDARAAKLDANASRSEADAARLKSDALLAELADLKAKKTDRGIELTLGDVLFSTGRAELKAGSAANLDKLVTALNGSPASNIGIDGYTDTQGSDDFNMALSQRRADSVSSYLTSRGISRSRISASGKGEAYPIAGNETAAGRQLNRRVVVTIQNPPE